LNSYGVNRLDFDSTEDTHRHPFKQITNQVLNQAHTDSIFMEYFSNKKDSESSPALRMVDSTAIIAKLEKMNLSSTRRWKFWVVV